MHDNPPVHDDTPKFESTQVSGIHAAVTGTWEWPMASAGQRASAYVLDALIISAVSALLEICCEKFLAFDLPSYAAIVLWTSYSLHFHLKTGQTLGKKFVGIKLVSAEPNGIDDRPNLSQIIRRETIGRIVCQFTLWVGYLVILLRADKRGLHDILYKTKVINLSGETKSIRFVHVLGGLIVLAIGVAGFIAYKFLYTTFPLEQVTKRLELIGYKVGELGGSYKDGFTIESLAKDTDDFHLEAKGIRFKIKKGDTEAGTQLVELNDLTIDKTVFQIKKWPEGYKPASLMDLLKRPFSGEKPPPESIPVAKKPKREAGELRMSSLNLQELEVLLPDRPAYKVSRLHVSDLRTQFADLATKIGRVYVASDLADVDVKELSIENGDIAIPHPMFVRVKPDRFPEVLKGPVTLSVDASYSKSRLQRLTLKGFNNALRLIWDGDAGEVLATNLTAAHFFKTELPLWNLNLRLAGKQSQQSFSEMKGSVSLRNNPFELEAGVFVLERGGKRYMLLPKVADDFQLFLAGQEKSWTLTSSENQTARDVLAELYFSKVFAALTPEESAHVTNDERFFLDAPNAVATPLAPIIAAPAPAPEQNRAPTSEPKKKIYRPELARKLPAKLPPKRPRN